MFIDALLIATGVVVGLMNSIAGGGTLLVYPVLMSLGVPALVVNATSYLAVLPGRLSAIVGYWPFLKKLPHIYVWLLIPTLFGAAGGALLLRNTSFALFDKLVPLLVILAIVLFAIQPWLKKHMLYHIDKRHVTSVFNAVILSIAMFMIALYGGYFGAGLGFALLAILGFNTKYKMHYLNGIKNVVGALVSIVVMAVMLRTGSLHWEYGIMLAIGNVIGGYYGARFSLSMPSHSIRWLVIATGAIVASYLFITYTW